MQNFAASGSAASSRSKLPHRLGMPYQKRQLAAPGRIYHYFSWCEPAQRRRTQQYLTEKQVHSSTDALKPKLVKF